MRIRIRNPDANCSSCSFLAISYYAAFLGWLISAAQWKKGIHGTKILNFFAFYWVIFAPLGPDPYAATQINAGPDPQPRKRRTWLKRKYVEEKRIKNKKINKSRSPVSQNNTQQQPSSWPRYYSYYSLSITVLVPLCCVPYEKYCSYFQTSVSAGQAFWQTMFVFWKKKIKMSKSKEN